MPAVAKTQKAKRNSPNVPLLPFSTLLTDQMKKKTNNKKPKYGLDHITFVSLRCGVEHEKAYTEAMYTLNI